jgi:spermidine/putrescine transport system ATP-binding protein
MDEAKAVSPVPGPKDELAAIPDSEAENLSGLSIRGIDKQFGDVQAIKNVSIDVPEGKFFTLLGPSGCGKTTLLRIIAGLELPDTGQVILGGQEITSLPATKRQVNTVFQSYALFPHLNIFENVAFGLRSRKVPQKEVETRVNRRLEMLGLEEMATRFPHQLSGGQQQRVALARALVNEPQVLLLDESMFVVPDLLGGAKYMLVGNLIQQQFGTSRDWPFGAAISMALMVLTMISLQLYRRRSKEVAIL